MCNQCEYLTKKGMPKQFLSEKKYFYKKKNYDIFVGGNETQVMKNSNTQIKKEKIKKLIKV